MENTLLKKVKGYTNIKVNPAKLNVIDPTKVSVKASVQEILDESEISKEG